MREKRSSELSAVLVIAATLGLTPACGRAARDTRDAKAGGRAGWVKMSGAALGTAVTAGSMPTYPAAAVNGSRGGVVVVSIEVNPDGHTDNVQVLEATYPDLGDAVVDAVKRWRCGPVSLGQPSVQVSVRSKLAFYFFSAGGRAVVFSPDYPASRSKQNALSGRARSGELPVITKAEARELMTHKKAVLVDVHGRFDRRKSGDGELLRVRVEDLWAKAALEVPLSASMLICKSDTEEADRSAIAARILSVVGFSDLRFVKGCYTPV